MYLDAAYLVRLYLDDPGADEVRALVDSASTLPASLIHGRAEVIGAFHRNFREGRISEQRLVN
jgi:predicted nucleic acid-binding protein